MFSSDMLGGNIFSKDHEEGMQAGESPFFLSQLSSLRFLTFQDNSTPSTMPGASVQARTGPGIDGGLNAQMPEVEAQRHHPIHSRLKTTAIWMAKAVAWQLLIICFYSLFLYGTGVITVNVEHPWVACVLEYWGVNLTVSSKQNMLILLSSRNNLVDSNG